VRCSQSRAQSALGKDRRLGYQEDPIAPRAVQNRGAETLDREPVKHATSHPWRRRLARGALAVLLPLVILELLLQIVALGVWIVKRPREEAARHEPGTRVILCTGDSFTYGIGASDRDHSYPAALERALNASGRGRFQVVNRGWPGQNSQDALVRIDLQLAETRPEIVCVLIGRNDLWSRPLHVVLPEEPVLTHSAWPPLEWRTWRLVKIVHEWLTGRAGTSASTGGTTTAASEPTIAGEWRCGPMRVRFEPDGRLLVNDRELHWQVRGSRLAIRADDGRVFSTTFQRDAGSLVIGIGELKKPIVLSAPSRSATGADGASEGPSDDDEGWRALQAGDARHAIELFRRRLAADPDDASARRGLAEALAQTGDGAQSREQQEWLRRHHQEVYSSHLRQLIARCRRAGAQVLLLCYPERLALMDDLSEQVARDEHTWWVDPSPAFAQALRTRPRDQLFVPDGHCNDAGYALMAEQVAAEILRHVPERGGG
jgi:lysophospholipase L1-like esterase